jgi:hypothetical protein
MRWSPLAIARWSSSAESADRMASATLVPTPCTERSSRNQSLSSPLANDDLVADRAERGQRPGRGEDEIADAVDVDHRMIGGEAVEQAAQLGDHAAWLPSARRLAR